MTNDILNRKEAADFLKISTRTLDRQIDLPRVKLTQRRIVFRRADLVGWIERRAEGQCVA